MLEYYQKMTLLISGAENQVVVVVVVLVLVVLGAGRARVL